VKEKFAKKLSAQDMINWLTEEKLETFGNIKLVK